MVNGPLGSIAFVCPGKGAIPQIEPKGEIRIEIEIRFSFGTGFHSLTTYFKDEYPTI